MWEMILAGRYMMIPITIASLVGMTIIIERMLVLRQRRIIIPEIAGAVETLSASEDLSVAYAICERHPGPFGNVVKAGLDHADNDWTIVRDVLEEAGRQEATLLTRRLGILETVAAVSPLLGLLGTVLGMMEMLLAANRNAPLVQSADLTGGLGTALAATAVSLVIAVLAYAGYNLLVSRVESILLDMERSASALMNFMRQWRQNRETPPA